MEFSNEEDHEQLGCLLEKLHQAGYGPGGNMTILYVAKGAQHVGYIQTQNVYADKRQGAPGINMRNDGSVFGEDTPLSALFRENHHEELRQVIGEWRPYLLGDDASVDALAMTRFEFDKKRIYSNRVYYDLLDLEGTGALKVSLSQLSNYLASHTNLSSSYATLYRQLKKYRQERP